MSTNQQHKIKYTNFPKRLNSFLIKLLKTQNDVYRRGYVSIYIFIFVDLYIIIIETLCLRGLSRQQTWQQAVYKSFYFVDN